MARGAVAGAGEDVESDMVTERRLVTEVIELGQTLFDALLETAEGHGAARNQIVMDPAEARAAADEFFAALRLLLGLNERRV
jgi:hypothetical protein